MRKIISLLILIIFVATLTACTPIPFDYDELVLNETVIRVELIYYDQPDVRQLSDLLGNAHRHHLDFYFELVEYLEILDQVYYESFFIELSKIYMHNPIQQNNSPSGIAILIHYTDGYFDVLSRLYVGRFNHEGKFMEFLANGVSDNIFEMIIEQYFNHEFQ